MKKRRGLELSLRWRAMFRRAGQSVKRWLRGADVGFVRNRCWRRLNEAEGPVNEANERSPTEVEGRLRI